MKAARRDPEPGALFSGLRSKSRIGRFFSLSLCAHAGGLWIGSAYLSFLSAFPHSTVPDLRHHRLLELNLDPLQHQRVSAPRPVAPPSPNWAGDPPPAPKADSPGEPASSPAGRSFRLPVPKPGLVPEQTLLQLDLPPTIDLHQQLRVPELILLAAALPRLQKPFVAPPQRKASPTVPQTVILDARPPILDFNPGYVKASEMPIPATAPLPAPAGAVSPVATTREPVENQPAATIAGTSPAEPLNIISLPDQPIPMPSSIVLPDVNQAGANSPLGNGRGENKTGAKRPESGSAGMTLALGGNPSEINPASGPRGATNSAQPSIGSENRSTGPPVRLLRQKDGGRYEVAVVQSSSGVPGSAGLLTGRPVYSVYISVGASKDWIIQYCLPDSGTARPRPAQVVQLGNIAPLTAPYAYSILRPEILFQPGARYAFIHGYVNSSGRFEQLEAVGDPALEETPVVLKTLMQWEFRPASKDGVPTLVEILLCIANPNV